MTIHRRNILAGLAAFGFTAPALGQVLVEGRPSGPGGGLMHPPRPRPVPHPEALIARSNLTGVVGFALVDVLSGDVIEAGGNPAAIAPASTLKAITALYAMNRLGPGHRFRTRLIRAGDTLVLVGGGDPVLDSDGLARLADELIAGGQASPARFAVWGGALPQIGEVSPGQDAHLAYNPSISGMILNFNRVHLDWRRADGGWRMSLEARAARQSPRAYTITAAPATQKRVFIWSADDSSEHWTVSRAALDNAGSRWLPVRRPELYAGDVFQTLCRARGLALPKPEVIAHLPAGEECARLDSPPLVDILRAMLFHSTNITAEVVGLHASGATDLTASAAAMTAWLQARGQAAGFVLADHSGLSAASRVTPQGLAQLAAFGAPVLDDLLKQDPLTADLPKGQGAQPQVRAKTGTLNFVSNLAGYIDLPSGRRLAFAVLCTDPPRHLQAAGKDLPAGVRSWTQQAKQLQYDLLEAWSARFT